MKLIGYDFSIAYKPGNNGAADALSRHPQEGLELGVLLSSNGIDWNCLDDEVRKDQFLATVRQAVEDGTTTFVGFSLEDGKLFYKGRYVLYKSSPFILVLLREYHDSPLGGHTKELKT